MSDFSEETSEFLFYTGFDGSIRAQVIVDPQNETVWVTQKGMAETFNADVSSISRHINNILSEGELDESTLQKVQIVNSNKPVSFYNLDMIIAVGYRVNSYSATQFRIWATKVLKEYLVKGFALDDERLKQGKKLFGKDYFDELLERIKEIRASERRFYQKITDIYAQCSIDYDAHSPITQTFYATVQNKLHWAIHKHTAAELIKLRANCNAPNMGLTTWKKISSGGKILKSDVSIAKNYLTKDEISALNDLVSMYLDFATNMAKRQKALRMHEWAEKLDSFLQFNEYEILNDAGKITHNVAVATAEKEYEKYRIIQDKEFKSDFDKVVEGIKDTGALPKEKQGFKRLEQPTISKSKKVITLEQINEALDKEESKFDKELKGILAAGKPPKDKE